MLPLGPSVASSNPRFPYILEPLTHCSHIGGDRDGPQSPFRRSGCLTRVPSKSLQMEDFESECHVCRHSPALSCSASRKSSVCSTALPKVRTVIRPTTSNG